MNISTIKDTIQSLAQSLQMTMILPASSLVLMNVYFILPRVWDDFDPASSAALTLAISFTLMVSYTLYAFNFPLIRLLEGYKLRETKLSRNRLRKQKQEFKRLVNKIAALKMERARFVNRLGHDPEGDGVSSLSKNESYEWGALKTKLAELEHRLDRHYPSTVHAVLPTSLGNVIAAFEDYPRTRYGMDTVALWPRLIPLLREEKYTEFVNQEKSVFDFLLNMLVVVAILGTELVYLNIFFGQLGLSVGIGVTTALLSLVLYQGILIAARQWGTTVRVAFDLYRCDLRRRLGLHPTENFREEYQRWQQISRFLLYRSKGVWFDGFISQSEMERKRNL